MSQAKSSRKRSGPGSLSSMTGFGKARSDGREVQIEIEIKSVNHRYFDFQARLPRSYAGFEHELKALVAEQVQRGRVELYVSRKLVRADLWMPELDRQAFDQLYTVYTKTCQDKGVLPKRPADQIDTKLKIVLELLKRAEVLKTPEERPCDAKEKQALFSALRSAMAAFSEMRRSEGLHLELELKQRLANLAKLKSAIAQESSRAPETLKEKLKARLEKLLADSGAFDPARIVQEAALLADRVDVTEELVRLESHFKQFLGAIAAGAGGRKLEFLIQEIAREFNTIGSKAQAAKVQSWVVDGKVELEKLREQVQNIE
jgi:uncharacterized protein (TIGR00255 family)